jgi:hypothetical protein
MHFQNVCSKTVVLGVDCFAFVFMWGVCTFVCGVCVEGSDAMVPR